MPHPILDECIPLLLEFYHSLVVGFVNSLIIVIMEIDVKRDRKVVDVDLLEGAIRNLLFHLWMARQELLDDRENFSKNKFSILVIESSHRPPGLSCTRRYCCVSS